MLEFWEAVLVDIGSLLVVVANGTKVLRAKGREEAAIAIKEKETKNPLLSQ